MMASQNKLIWFYIVHADLIKQSRQGMPDNVILVINVHVFHRGPFGGTVSFDTIASRVGSVSVYSHRGGGDPDKTPCPPLSVSGHFVSKTAA